MAALIAVDWGTSSLRAALLDARGQVLAQSASKQGVAGIAPGAFEDTLYPHIAPWLAAHGALPVIMCGMVGATIGWCEAPYQSAPLVLNALAGQLLPVPAQRFRAWIVPGVRGQSPWGEPDVMRGEETQILGWQLSNPQTPSALLCLPGTHTKWVQLIDGRLQQFATAFSGELFALLQQGSVLIRGPQVFERSAFLAGVARTAQGEALNHVLFSARSRVLAGQLAAEHAGAYVSGLLLGAEIAGYQPALTPDTPVHIIATPELAEAYQSALGAHAIDSRVYPGTDLAIAGLWHLAQALPELAP